MNRFGATWIACVAAARLWPIVAVVALLSVGGLVGGQVREPLPPPTLPANTPASRDVPISLDAVLRLAEDQNHQISIARERVEEACAERALAAKAWLPSVNIGTTYYRHEGGISDFHGELVESSWGSLFAGAEITSRVDLREACFTKINAERALWQQRGELRRITSETLMEATNSYIDFLAIRTGAAIALSRQKDVEELYARAQKCADPKTGDPALRVEVARVQAYQKATQLAVLELRQQSARAAVRLIYQLGLDPNCNLVPIDLRLVPFDLVNVTPPLEDLVAQALQCGPGIEEMEGILAQIHESQEKSKSCERFLPQLDLKMAEGVLTTGPGSHSESDNSFNVWLSARWNLTDLLTNRERQRVLDSKRVQAHLAYQDLKAKLTAGVQESREVILGSKELLRLGQEQIDTARRAYDLSKERLLNHIPGSSYSEVLMSMQGLSAAQAAYIGFVQAHDKAELRLLIVLGQNKSRQ
jgi:outer membrane protein TolC